MDDDQNKEFKKMQERIAALEEQVALPTHYHNGFDSNLVSWSDLSQRKVWVAHTVPGLQAATATNYGVFYVVQEACLVTRIQEVHMTLGTDAGAVSLNIEHLTGTEALDAGDALLLTAFDLKASINVVRTGTLVSTPTVRTLARGDRLAMDDAGTLTAVANVTVLVELQF